MNPNIYSLPEIEIRQYNISYSDISTHYILIQVNLVQIVSANSVCYLQCLLTFRTKCHCRALDCQYLWAFMEFMHF